MKAKDLMIGDWVLMRGTPVQVRAIGVNTIRFSDMLITEPLENIEPIPLTKEILKKNGFEKNEYGDFYLDIVVGYVGITVEEIPISNKLFFEIEYACLGETFHPHTINVQLNYVHELQHALRLIGIEREVIL